MAAENILFVFPIYLNFLVSQPAPGITENISLDMSSSLCYSQISAGLHIRISLNVIPKNTFIVQNGNSQQAWYTNKFYLNRWLHPLGGGGVLPSPSNILDNPAI